VTGIGDIKDEGLPINLWLLSMMQKRIQGVIFGMGTPPYEITRLAALYKAGRLKLDELITTTYRWTRSTRLTPTCTPAATSAASSSTAREWQVVPGDHLPLTAPLRGLLCDSA